MGPDNGIYIVEELGSLGRRAGKIDGIRDLKFSLLWRIFSQYCSSKTSQMRATGRDSFQRLATDGYSRRVVHPVPLA